MTDQANSAVGDQEVLIASGTIAFHNAFEPKPFMRNGQAVGAAYYNVTMLYDASVLEDAKTLAVSVAKEKWGDIKGVRFPFLKGEVEAKKAVARAKAKGKTNYEKAGDFYGDSIVMKAKTQYEVPVYDMNGKEMLSQKDLYSGAIATIPIKFVANEISETNPETGEPDNKRYVSAYLQAIKKTGKGERLFGRDLSDVFGGTKDSDEALGTTNPADLDDEIPF